MTVNGEQLAMRDAARVRSDDAGATQLRLAAGDGGAHFMLIEMAKSSD